MYYDGYTIVFGWPAVALAVIAHLAAVLLRNKWLGAVAAVVAAPFCWFVSKYPLIGLLGYVVLALNAANAVALWRGQRAGAVICWIPFLLLAGWLAVTVLRQPI